MTEVLKPTMQNYHRYLLVCVGERCTKNGEGQALYDELKLKLSQNGLSVGALRVKRNRVTCFGVCRSGPLVCVQPDGIWYYDVTGEKMDKIIQQHLIGGKPVPEWIFHQTSQTVAD